MQEEQRKRTDIHKDYLIRSTAGLSTDMTAWLLGVTVFSEGCALMQAYAAVGSC